MGKYDLKEYYDTCMEEQQVGNYRADLLLTKSTRKDRAPVSIEFMWLTGVRKLKGVLPLK